MRGEGNGGAPTHVLVARTEDSAPDIDVSDASRVLGVAYEHDAETWLERCNGNAEQAAVVSVGERSRSAASTSAGGSPLTAVAGVVETVADEADVGTVGSLVQDYLTAWEDADATTVFVDDLAAVVDHTSTETAFRFTHATLSCAEATDARVVASFDPDAYPPHVVGTFGELFDDVRD